MTITKISGAVTPIAEADKINEIIDNMATGVVWGSITGTMSDQTDLQTALNAAVHKTGDETIRGIKTFNNEIDIGNTSEYKKTIYQQSNGSYVIAMNKQDNSGWMSYIQMSTAGRVVINAGDATATDRVIALQGNSATAPTPATSDNSTKIATTGWVNTVGNNVVHKTGDETIGGNKTFTLDITRKFGTTVDGSNHYNTPLVLRDSNGTITGYLRNAYYSNNAIAIGVQTVRTINGVAKYANMEVGIKEDGTFYTAAPTPAVSDNSTQIATTAYVNNKHVVVSTLPASPDADVYYYIPE